MIGAVPIPGASAPKRLKKKYLKEMKPGLVVVDAAIDQGDCFGTSRAAYHHEPAYAIDGVVHYCIGNMPGAIPRTGTLAPTNATLPYGLRIADTSLREAASRDEGLKRGINIESGKCIFDKVAERFGLPYHPAPQ